MMKLNDFLTVAAEVEVGGEPVRIKHLTDVKKRREFVKRSEKIQSLPRETEKELRHIINLTNNLKADMMAEVVMDHSYSKDDWLMVARASNEPANDESGLPNMVMAVQRACGLIDAEDDADVIEEAYGDTPFLPQDQEGGA